MFEKAFGAITGLVILAVIVLMGFVAIESMKAHDEFMRECLQDHKQYECTALYCAGNHR